MKINKICKTPDPEGRRLALQAIYDKYGTYEKCAKKCGVVKDTFWAWCRRYGVQVNAEYRKERPYLKGKRGPSVDWDSIKKRMGYVNLKSMLSHCKLKYTYVQAAKLLGVSTQAYYAILKDHGLVGGAKS